MMNAVLHIASRHHRQSHSPRGTGTVSRRPLRLDLPNCTLQSGGRQPNSTPATTSKPPFRPQLPPCPADLSVEASAKAGAPPKMASFLHKTTLPTRLTPRFWVRFLRTNPPCILRNIFMARWIRISHLASFRKKRLSRRILCQPSSHRFPPHQPITAFSHAPILSHSEKYR
jgi:hypothetical protein